MLGWYLARHKSLFSFSHTFKVWHLLREDRGNSYMEIKMSALLPTELLENVVHWRCTPAWHRLTHPVTALEKHSLDRNAEAVNRPERTISFRWTGLRGRRVAKPSILFLKSYSTKTGRSKWRSRKKARALGHWNTKQEENSLHFLFPSTMFIAKSAFVEGKAIFTPTIYIVFWLIL